MSLDLAGEWEGRWQVQPGREDDLTATEKKRFLKTVEVIPLIIRSDGTFLHKNSVEGVYKRSETEVNFQPRRIDGHSLEELQSVAETQGRVFKLEFLFDSFSLVIKDESLLSPDDRKLLRVMYRRP